MEQNNTDEIDLGYVYNVIKKTLKKCAILFFRFLDFCFRKWIIILILLIAGISYGYYIKTIEKEKKETSVLLRINFDTVDYVYSMIELFDRKIQEYDYDFIEEVGLSEDSLEIIGIEIDPVINFKDIITNYGDDGKYLGNLLQNIEFKDRDVVVSNTFNSEYKNHLLHIYLASNGTNETIDKVISKINNNEFLQKIKVREVKNIEGRILNNNKIVDQIDNVIKAFNSNESLLSPSEEIYVVDKNFNIELLLRRKMAIQRENEDLENELLYSTDIAVIINKPLVTTVEKTFSSNKLTYYPFLFIGWFFVLAFMRHSFFYIKELVNKENNR